MDLVLGLFPTYQKSKLRNFGKAYLQVAYLVVANEVYSLRLLDFNILTENIANVLTYFTRGGDKNTLLFCDKSLQKKYFYF